MNSEQAQFLSERLDEWITLQPPVMNLRTKLLAIAGEQIVFPGSADPDLETLIQSGSLQAGEIIFCELESNSCHENCAALWLQHSVSGIGTGYALSDDGLWRQHSWGVRKDSAIIETTEVRTHYFGVLLQEQAAQRFAFSYFEG